MAVLFTMKYSWVRSVRISGQVDVRYMVSVK